MAGTRSGAIMTPPSRTEALHMTIQPSFLAYAPVELAFGKPGNGPGR